MTETRILLVGVVSALLGGLCPAAEADGGSAGDAGPREARQPERRRQEPEPREAQELAALEPRHVPPAGHCCIPWGSEATRQAAALSRSS